MEIVITVLAIIACILLFSLAIFIHEFGHFLAARKLGMKVDAFSIGFGPVLWKCTRGGVEYRLSAIPFGGYVALPELDPAGTQALEGAKADKTKDEATKANAPSASISPMVKIIVAFAGPFGNLVLAVFLAIGLSLVPGARFGERLAEIGFVPEKGPAAEAGIKVGDRITAVNGNAVSNWVDMQTEVQIAGERTAVFSIVRGGTNVTLTVKARRDEASGAYFIMAFSTTNGVASAAWMPARSPYRQLAWDVGSIARVLKALGTPSEAKSAAKALGGPVMIAEGLYTQVRRNGWDALGFLRFLCVNLAIINLLPIPVLDGGLIFFALIELVTRRRVPRRFVDWVSKFFMILLLGLMLLLVWRDVMRSVRIHRATSITLSQRSEHEPK